MTTASRKDLTDANRRRVLIASGSMLGMVICGVPRLSRAADLPHLSPDDPTAQALGYHEDSSKVDAAKYPTHKPELACSNCNFYQSSSTDYGPCQLYPGKAVSAKGWCAGYAKKA